MPSSSVVPKKRKSGASSSGAAKKAKLLETGAQTVDTLLSDVENYNFPSSPEDVRETLISLAQYARSLEEDIDASKPKEKSREEILAAAEKLKSVGRSGITKQMNWKVSCKTNSAKWVYDGVCSDPSIFGAALGLDGPPTFKLKKMTAEEFQNVFGSCTGSARYNDLYINGQVNIRWNAEECTFKLSGSYGISP
ncbi:hypothetical protein BDQ17DRAFT_1238739 [Cyathus striatus]|nr:hypothetical protein BDQ17DRAFT_1238739 [Cyathus striatus]